MPLTSSSSPTISAGGFGGQPGLGLAAVRRDVAHDVDDFFERPRDRAREAAGAEHRAAERQQHQRERERVVAGRLQADVGERLLDEHLPAGRRHHRHRGQARPTSLASSTFRP